MNPEEESHAELLSKVGEMIDAVLLISEEIRDALLALAQHNSDPNSHEDIRMATSSGSGGDISEHNNDPIAHPNIREQINSSIDNSTAILEKIAISISEHNVSITAHDDIRVKLNELKLHVNELNVETLKSQLGELLSITLPGYLSTISELRETVTDQSALVQRNATDIAALRAHLEIVDVSVYLAAEAADDAAISAARAVVTAAAAQAHLAQTTTWDTTMPNLYGFTHTMPTLVYPRETVKFTISGAEVADGQVVKYSIDAKNSGIVFFTTSGILDGQLIECMIPSSTPRGSILLFSVTAENDTTKKTAMVMLGTQVATAVDNRRVITNIPVAVEPGEEYPFTISYVGKPNLYTFGIDSKLSELIFDKDSELQEGDVVTLLVPTSAVRNTTVSFDIVIVDAGGNKVNKNVTLRINVLPSTENFIHTVPDKVKPGQNVAIFFDGIVSDHGVPAKYNIINTHPELTFSKTENVLANEVVTMGVGSGISRDGKYEITIRAIDEIKATVDIVVPVKINQLPTSTTVDTSFRTRLPSGITEFSIYGGFDSDGGVSNLRYAITDIPNEITINKTTNISSSDTLQVTAPKVSTDSSVLSFKIYVSDDLGERSLAPKVVDFVLAPTLITAKPTITSPINGAVITTDTFTITWTPYATAAEE